MTAPLSTSAIRKLTILLYMVLFLPVLVACGPSAADVQSTVVAAVAATSQQAGVATSVAATQTAANACGSAALNTYADGIEKQMDRFERQATLVGSTSRVGMGEPMQRLLDLQDETDQLDAPKCLADYHKRVIGMMEFHRMAYSNFSAQGDDTFTQALLMTGQDELKLLRDALPDIRAGKVPNIPPAPTPVT